LILPRTFCWNGFDVKLLLSLDPPVPPRDRLPPPLREPPKDPPRESAPNDDPPRELFREVPRGAGDVLFRGARPPSEPRGASPFNGDKPPKPPSYIKHLKFE